VAMAVLSPFDATRHQVHGTLIKLIEKECEGVIARYQNAFDPRVDILTGDRLCFYRWLRVHMERTRAEIEQELGRMEPTKRNLMRTLQPATSQFTP